MKHEEVIMGHNLSAGAKARLADKFGVPITDNDSIICVIPETVTNNGVTRGRLHIYLY